jgi:hypothetical protein
VGGGDCGVVDLESAVVVGVEHVYPRRGQRHHPPDVGGTDEVPGGTQDVGTQDGAVREPPVEVVVA